MWRANFISVTVSHDLEKLYERPLYTLNWNPHVIRFRERVYASVQCTYISKNLRKERLWVFFLTFIAKLRDVQLLSEIF